MPEPAERSTTRAQRAIAVAATLACFGATFLLALTRVVGERITSDEQIFVGGAGLMARGDGLIYRDFFYTHVPLHAGLLAGLFQFTDRWMLAGRLVDAACFAGIATLIFHAARRALDGLATGLRLAGAAAVAMLLVFHPIAAYTAGIAWNHNLATLCCLAAIAMLTGRPSASRIVASGALAAAAATARLTFAPVVAVIPIALWFADSTALMLRPRQAGMPVLRKARTRAVALWLAGAAAVALPSLVVCLQDPAAAYFQNVKYPGLTARFSTDLGDNPRVTFGGKVEYLVAQYGKPAALPLLATTIVVCGLSCVTRFRDREPHAGVERTRATPDPAASEGIDPGWRERFQPLHLMTIIATGLVAFAASFAATPMFRQYLYSPLPLAALALAAAIGLLPTRWRMAVAIALLPLAIFCALQRDKTGYRPLRTLASPAEWTTTRWHADARALAARVPASGKVLTLMPGLPLEAGRPVYIELSIGRYAARSAAYLTPEQRAAHRVPTLDEIRAWFATDPPAAVLLNAPLDTALEHRLDALARDAGYVAEPLGPRWTLYRPPPGVDR